MKEVVTYLLLLVLVGCRNKQDFEKMSKTSSGLIIVEVFKDNRLVNRCSYESEGIKTGEQVSYYKNGGIKLIVNYVSNEKEGFERMYYPNGNLAHIGKYSHGKMDSVWNMYYPDGVMKSVLIYANGKKNRETKFFFRNSTVKSYLFYFPAGKLAFRSDYDSLSNLIEQGGRLQMGISVNKGIKDYVPGDSLRLYFLEATPPKIRQEFVFKLLRNGSILKAKSVKTKNGEGEFDYSPLTTGVYTVTQIHTVFDSTSLEERRAEFSFQITCN